MSALARRNRPQRRLPKTGPSEIPLDALRKPLLTYSYPAQGSGRLQAFFSASKEFRELEVGAREYHKDDLVTWNGGSFYPHQIVAARLVEIYPRLLVMDRTGTGKFYVALAIAEMFRHSLSSPVASFLARNFRSVNRVFYVVTSSFLQGEVKENIRRITGQKVNTDGKRVRRRFYNVLMLDAFLSIAIPGKDYIRNAAVIVDEAHNIRKSPLRGALEALLADPTSSVRVIPMTATPAYSGAEDAEALMNVLLPPERTLDIENVPRLPGSLQKELADYVTYMRESRSSVVRVSVANYEIPDTGFGVHASFMQHRTAGNTVPSSSDVSLTSEERKVLAKFLRKKSDGLASAEGLTGEIRKSGRYGEMTVAQLRATAKLFGVAAKGLRKKKDILAAVLRSEEARDAPVVAGQAYQYYKWLRDTNRDDPDAPESAQSRALYTKDQQISGFVFPDGSYGETGFSRHVNLDSRGNFSIRTGDAGDVLGASLSDVAGMRTLSARNATIVTMTDENAGTAFVLLKSVRQCIMLALCFETLLGYRRLRGAEKDLIASDGSLRAENIPEGNNYAFLRSGMTKTEREALFAVFNHPENAEGRYLRIIITTPVSGEGINLYNVTLVHITSRWVWKKMYQVESRGYRTGVHNPLREARVARGDLSPVEVKVVYHATILRLSQDDERVFAAQYAAQGGSVVSAAVLDEDLLVMKTPEGADYSIDGYKYKKALAKQGPSDWFENEMRGAAITYGLFGARNAATADPSLQFRSVLPEAGAPHPSNAISVHAEGAASALARHLARVDGSVTLEELADRLFRHRPDVPPAEQRRRTQHALFLLHERSQEIVDRYGVSRFVHQEGNRVALLQPHENPDMATAATLYYERPELAPRSFSLQDIADAMNMLPELTVASFAAFGELSSPAERIENIEAAYVLAREPEAFAALSAEEKELVRLVNEGAAPSMREGVRYKDEAIIGKFVTAELRQEKLIKSEVGDIPRVDDRRPGVVLYHNGESSIETYKANTELFGDFVVAKLKSLKDEGARTRIYDAGRNRWRDASPAEHIIYVFLETSRYNREKRDPKFRDKVYMLSNFVEPPKKSVKFVVDEDPRAAELLADSRKKKTGLAWGSWTLIDALELVYAVFHQRTSTASPLNTDASRSDVAPMYEGFSARVGGRFPPTLDQELETIKKVALVARIPARKRTSAQRKLANDFLTMKTFLLLHERRAVADLFVQASDADEQRVTELVDTFSAAMVEKYSDKRRKELENNYLAVFVEYQPYEKASVKNLLIAHLSGEEAKEQMIINL